MTYRTTRDIIIPAGTVIQQPPARSSRWGSHHEAVVGHGRDDVSYWSVNLDDALRLGLVEKAD